MNYSFVIQAVIKFVIQALPADSARGQRDHQDKLSTQTDLRPRIWLDEGGLRAGKCMLNQCSDDDAQVYVKSML